PSPAWLTLPGRNRAPVFGLPNFMQSVFNTEKTGISSGEKALAYPNPVSGGTLTIFQKAATAEAVRVTDLQGKDIRTRDIKLLPDRIVLNTASWPSGQTYLVQVAGVSYKIVKI
ncbi:T9SS type A sorting domain-containing protein, partial [Siphonobacter aquaeclarae]